MACKGKVNAFFWRHFQSSESYLERLRREKASSTAELIMARKIDEDPNASVTL